MFCIEVTLNCKGTSGYKNNHSIDEMCNYMSDERIIHYLYELRRKALATCRQSYVGKRGPWII